MAVTGNRPTIRILQKRLTIVVAVLGLLGCLVLGLLWRDSVENYVVYSTKNCSIIITGSSAHYESMRFSNWEGYGRISINKRNLYDQSLFPGPRFSNGFISIPIYLLILAYLATLLLIWLVLMNRLARRHFKNTTSTPAQD